MSRHRHYGRNRQYSYDYDDDYYDDYDDYDEEEEQRQLDEYNREQREAREKRERDLAVAAAAAAAPPSPVPSGPYSDSDTVIAGVMSAGFDHPTASSAFSELNPTSQLPYESQIEAVVDFILNKPIDSQPSSSSTSSLSIPLPTKPPSPPVVQPPPMSPPRFYKEGTAMSPPSAGLKSLWNKVEQEKATSAVKRQLSDSLRNQSYKVPNPSFTPFYADTIKEIALPVATSITNAPITICVSGHIDHGKTTLVEKLVQMLDGRRVVLDTGLAEKSRSCTTDVSVVHCKTPSPTNRTLTILDTPGHEGYSLQLIPALFECDVGVFVVSCKKGEFEDCWGGAGKIHLQSMIKAGVGKIVVAVNKCDVGEWEGVGRRVVDFLEKDGGVQATACGVSGLSGDNVLDLVKSIEAAAGLRKGKGKGKKSFRATVSSVTASGRRVNMQVKVIRGNLTIGETVSVAPSGVCGVVKEIYIGDQVFSEGTIGPGDNVTVSVVNMDAERVFGGDVLVRSGDLRCNVNSRRRLAAKIEVGEKTVIKGTEFTFTMNACSTTCVVAHVLDGDKRMIRGKARGSVTLVLKRPIVIEKFAECKKLGRFMLLDGARIAAVGMIEELL